MHPRLKSSTKWTNLPQDVTSQIQKVFEQNFQKELGQSKIIVEGRLYPHEILLRVGYLEKGRLTQNNFEVSVDYHSENENSALENIHLCVDVAASLLTEHFEAEGDLEIPTSWTEFPFEDKKVWLQFSTENTSLEKQANELLGEWDDSLVQEALDAEEEEYEEVGAEDDSESSESVDDLEDQNQARSKTKKGPKGTLH